MADYDTTCDFKESKPRRNKLALGSKSKTLRTKRQKLCSEDHGDKSSESNEFQSSQKCSLDSIKQETLNTGNAFVVHNHDEKKAHDETLGYLASSLNHENELKNSIYSSNSLNYDAQDSGTFDTSGNEGNKLLPSITVSPTTVAVESSMKKITNSNPIKSDEENVHDCVKISCEPTEEVWCCILCNNSFPWTEQKVHLSDCMKQFECKIENSDSNSCPEVSTEHNFHCEICKKDITHLTIQDRCEHMNCCLDLQSRNSAHITPNGTTSSSESYIRVSECPVCGSQFTSVDIRLKHIKTCCKKHRIGPQKVILALQLQEKYALERNSLGLPPLQIRSITYSNPKPLKYTYNYPKPSKQKIIHQPKSGPESDLQIAMALSLSLKEEEIKKQKMLKLVLGECGDDFSNFLGSKQEGKTPDLQPLNINKVPDKVKSKAKKNNVNKPVPALLLRSEKERLQLMEDKISSLVTLLKPTVADKAQSAAPNIEAGVQESNNNFPEACHLWSLAGSMEDKDMYYTPELQEWITPSTVAAGSKLLSLSQVPGHKIDHDHNFEYSALYNPETKDAVLSQKHSSNFSGEILSTQEMIDIIVNDDTYNYRRNLEVHHDSAWPFEEYQKSYFENQDKNNGNGFFTQVDRVCHTNRGKPNPVIKGLLNLVGNSWMSDVDIIVKGQTFIPAHRLLLMMRCPSIEKELQIIPQNEKVSLDWNNISYESSMEFLSFIYTGTCKLNAIAKEGIFQLFIRYDMAEAFEELINEEKNSNIENLIKHEDPSLQDDIELQNLQTNSDSLPSCDKSSQCQTERIETSVPTKDDEHKLTRKRRFSSSECPEHNFEDVELDKNVVGKTFFSNVSLSVSNLPSSNNELNTEHCQPSFQEDIERTNENELTSLRIENEVGDPSRKFVFMDFKVAKPKEEYSQYLSPEKYSTCKFNTSVNSPASPHIENLPMKIDSPLRIENSSPAPVHDDVNSMQTINTVIEKTEQRHKSISPEKYVMCKLNHSLLGTSNEQSPSKAVHHQKLENMAPLPICNDLDDTENAQGVSCLIRSGMDLLVGNGSFASSCSKSVYNKSIAVNSPELFVCESDNEISPSCDISETIHDNHSLESDNNHPVCRTVNLTAGNLTGDSVPISSVSRNPTDNSEEEIVIIKEIGSINKGNSELIFDNASELFHHLETKTLPALENSFNESKNRDKESKFHLHNLKTPDDEVKNLLFNKLKSSFLEVHESVLDTPIFNKSRNGKYKQCKRKLSEKFSYPHEKGESYCSKSLEKNTDGDQISSPPASMCISDIKISEVIGNISKGSKSNVSLSPKPNVPHPEGPSQYALGYLSDVWDGFDDAGVTENFILHNRDATMQENLLKEPLPSVSTLHSQSVKEFLKQPMHSDDHDQAIKKTLVNSDSMSDDELPSLKRPMHSDYHGQTIKKTLSNSDCMSDDELPSLDNRIQFRSLSKKADIPKLIDEPSQNTRKFLSDSDSASDDENLSVIEHVHLKDLSEQAHVKKPAAESDTNTQDYLIPESRKLESNKAYQMSSSPITPMPNYKALMTPELKLQLQRFGVRALSRKKAVAVLQHIYDETHPWVEFAEQNEPNHSGISVEKVERLPSVSEVLVNKSEASKLTQVKETSELENEQMLKNRKKCRVIKTHSNPSAIKSNQELEISLDSSDEELDLSGSQTSSKSDASDLPEESLIHLEQVSDSQQIPCSQDKNTLLSDKIRNYILSNNSLYAKILTYEPLNLTEFHQELKQSGIKTSVPKVMDFLDEQCITFTLPRSEKFKKQQQERNKRFKKCVLAKLSQQSSV